MSPFLLSHELEPELFRKMKNKPLGATVNDLVLTAYFRALSEMLELHGEKLAVPIMIDMRRYIEDKSFSALTNITSTSIVRLGVPENEDFVGTLGRLCEVMQAKKADNLGMNTFVKLYAGFRLPFVNAYGVMGRVLKNPKISMTNIGVIAPERLVFEGCAVKNAVMYASIKYRPHVQLSVTSFGDRLTFSAGMVGDGQDRINIERLFLTMDKELQNAKF